MTGATVFRSPSGGTVEVAVVGASVTSDDVRLVVEATPDAWDTIDLVMFFHLRWEIRNAGEVSGTRPVQLELRLSPALIGSAEVGEMASSHDPVSWFTGLDADHPLRSVNAWYAATVTEAVDLPPGLAGTGEVRTGFSTRWAETLDDPSRTDR